jgi:hypothetical protein
MAKKGVKTGTGFSQVLVFIYQIAFFALTLRHGGL